MIRVADQEGLVDHTLYIRIARAIARHGNIDPKGLEFRKRTDTLSIGDKVTASLNGSLVDAFHVNNDT